MSDSESKASPEFTCIGLKRTKWVPCDHVWCEEPTHCRDGEWVMVENNCQIELVNANLDVCTTCEKLIHYG
jgi:hypothetical protein